MVYRAIEILHVYIRQTHFFHELVRELCDRGAEASVPTDLDETRCIDASDIRGNGRDHHDPCPRHDWAPTKPVSSGPFSVSGYQLLGSSASSHSRPARP